MKQFIALLLLISLCPYRAKAQSIEEIHRAMDVYDYEMPITRIAPVAGDSVLTPLRAQALRAMNRYPEALKEWNSLLKADSANTKVLIELAECYKLVNRGKEATACYGKAVDLHPENSFFRQQYIRSLLAGESYEAARSACHVWLEKDSMSATAYKFLGIAYEGMVAADDPDALSNAFMAYNAAYRIDSLDAQTVAHIAAIFNNNEQFRDAVDVTEKYQLTDTLNIDVNRQNAKAYCMLKEYPTAVKRYEALKEMGDRSFATLYYLGVSHYGDNWMYGAYDNLLLAHKKSPMDVNVLYYLGKAAARTSWKKDGLDYLKEAIEIAVPTDSLMARLYDGLVECYRYINEPYEKIEAMKKLYSYNKKYTLFYNIAYTYDHQKDYANAVHYYEKYMSMVPADKQIVLDSDGKPMPNSDTLYQKARRRVEKIKAEDFFRNGVHDDYFEPKFLKAVKQKADSLNKIK